MANGKIVYPSGEATQVTYTFDQNFDEDYDQVHIDSDDFERGYDGTLHSHTGFRKKTFTLSFSYVSKAQLEAFQLAYLVGGKIDLYLDGTTLDGVVLIMEPIEASSEGAFDGSDHTYSFDVVFEEV